MFSQIIAERKFAGQLVRGEREWLTLPNPFAIKTLRALCIVLQLCEGAYSAVAQWQSIRLLTEGL